MFLITLHVYYFPLTYYSFSHGVENSKGYIFYPGLFCILMAWILFHYVTLLPAGSLRTACLPIICSVYDGYMASISPFNVRGKVFVFFFSIINK